jgi:hypothetical protein
VAISLKNELKACCYGVKLIDDYLAKYPTRYEEDCQQLLYGSVPLFSNQRNALIQVKGEKEVLLFYREWLQTGILGLKCKEYSEFDSYLNEMRTKKHSLIFQYCRSTIARLVQDAIRRGDSRSKKTLDLSKPTVV